MPCYTFPPCLPGPGRLAVPARPVASLSGLLLPSPAPPGSGCPQLHRPAATGRRWALAAHPVAWRLAAHGVVDAVGTRQHRMDQGQQLAPGTGGAGLIAQV